MLISFVNINPECEQVIKISVHGSPPRVRPFTSNPRTRGSQILIALLSTRNHNRIFSRCHYFARSDEMNLATWEETNSRTRRQKRTNRQIERLQARARLQITSLFQTKRDKNLR